MGKDFQKCWPLVFSNHRRKEKLNLILILSSRIPFIKPAVKNHVVKEELVQSELCLIIFYPAKTIKPQLVLTSSFYLS